jgi:uncharacterized protein YndB with AHSA1/START domain
MPQTAEVATPSDLEIQVTRTFDAPARIVFEYFTKPELVSKWLLGPPDWSMPVCKIDLAVGGRYEYVWRNDTTGMQFGARGEYLEVVVPERLVHRERMDGADGEALCTAAFTESGERTTLTMTIRFETKAARDEALESGMTGGMSASYDRLEDFMNANDAAGHNGSTH